MCSSDNQGSKPVFLQRPANLPPNTANQDLDSKNKLPWPMEDNGKTFVYDTGIRCWGVCLTSVVLKMVSMGVGNCFGAILLVRGHSSLFGSQGGQRGVGVGSSNFWNNENKCFFNKHTIKICVSCSWRCPGTSAPSVPHLGVKQKICVSLMRGHWFAL